MFSVIVLLDFRSRGAAASLPFFSAVQIETRFVVTEVGVSRLSRVFSTPEYVSHLFRFLASFFTCLFSIE
jgi:hypothetical protein